MPPALIVIGCILAFFVLLFTVRVRVNIKMKDELELTVIAFGARIRILPKKPKKYNLKKYTLKKIQKRDEKAALKAQKKAEAKAKKKKEKAEVKKKAKALTKEQKKAIKAKKKASRPPIPDMISLFKEVIGLFFGSFFSKFHFHVAKIIIKVGGSDAAKIATTHGAICAALGPTLCFIDRHSNLHTKRRTVVYIEPDFTSKKISMDIDVGFSLSLGGVLSAAIKAGWRFIMGWTQIKPTPPTDANNSTSSQKPTPVVNQTPSSSELKAPQDDTKTEN